MSNGVVFDIKEFALHDGDGLRTTVFLKGCPMRCVWCHNPEGQSFLPELTKNRSRCTNCGMCKKPCLHDGCRPYGVCLRICPQNCLKVCGEEYSPAGLAARLLQNREFLKEGGVTFSGGEPLMQLDFISETVQLLDGIGKAVETCGFVSENTFRDALRIFDTFFFDIKLFDNDLHRKYTEQDNGLVLQNALTLLRSETNAVIRVPLIPGITDTDSNLMSIADFLSPYSEKISVELLPYNRMTGAKYSSLGKKYSLPFDETKQLNKNTKVFEQRHIKCKAY